MSWAQSLFCPPNKTKISTCRSCIFSSGHLYQGAVCAGQCAQGSIHSSPEPVPVPGLLLLVETCLRNSDLQAMRHRKAGVSPPSPLSPDHWLGGAGAHHWEVGGLGPTQPRKRRHRIPLNNSGGGNSRGTADGRAAEAQRVWRPHCPELRPGGQGGQVQGTAHCHLPSLSCQSQGLGQASVLPKCLLRPGGPCAPGSPNPNPARGCGSQAWGTTLHPQGWEAQSCLLPLSPTQADVEGDGCAGGAAPESCPPCGTGCPEPQLCSVRTLGPAGWTHAATHTAPSGVCSFPELQAPSPEGTARPPGGRGGEAQPAPEHMLQPPSGPGGSLPCSPSLPTGKVSPGRVSTPPPHHASF